MGTQKQKKDEIFLKILAKGGSLALGALVLAVGGVVIKGVDNSNVIKARDINSGNQIDKSQEFKIYESPVITSPSEGGDQHNFKGVESNRSFIDSLFQMIPSQSSKSSFTAKVIERENNSLVEREETLRVVSDKVPPGKVFRLAIVATAKESCPYYYTSPIGPGADSGRLNVLFGEVGGSYGEKFEVVPVLMERGALKDNECSDDNDYASLIGTAVGEKMIFTRSSQVATTLNEH